MITNSPKKEAYLIPETIAFNVSIDQAILNNSRDMQEGDAIPGSDFEDD